MALLCERQNHEEDFFQIMFASQKVQSLPDVQNEKTKTKQRCCMSLPFD